MASYEDKLLRQMIQKLGLTEYDSLMPKATELLRLLQIRAASGTTILGDYAKATLCIDLASRLLALPFDQDTGLKLSGLRKTAYNNSKRTLEKILDLNRTVGIGDICAQLGISQVQQEARKLLEEYKRYVSGERSNEVDFTHPQYATMAVFHACRRQKVKPPRAKLIALSHLKPAQWALLEKTWDNFLTSYASATATAKKVAGGDNAAAIDLAEHEKLDDEVGQKKVIGKHPSPEKIEPYQNWKKRMLEKAHRELALLEQQR